MSNWYGKADAKMGKIIEEENVIEDSDDEPSEEDEENSDNDIEKTILSNKRFFVTSENNYLKEHLI